MVEFPEERETINRLEALVRSGKHREMTFDHLIYRVEPRSIEALARILERLVTQGTIRRVYRVESPGIKGKIDDFERFEDIPEEIDDWHTGTKLHVTPGDLSVVYLT